MRLIFITIPQNDAEAMLMLLLRERLVAGGTILPAVHSRYWWNGEILAQQEAGMLLETASDRVEEATTRIRELHPFDSPRIIILRPHEGPGDYFRWVRSETRA